MKTLEYFALALIGIGILGIIGWVARAFFVDPEIQQNIVEAAKTDPLFALKLAEHGWGRPPQSLAVDVTDKRQLGVYRAEFADGAAVHPPAPPELPN